MAACRNCGEFLGPRKMMCVRCGDWSPNAGDAATVGDTVKEDDFMDAVDVEASTVERIVTGGPWDDVWGGGFVPTSITLLGGAPGAGKSTLLLQLSISIAQLTKRPTYYISAEQDKGELKMTLQRINLPLERGQLRVLKKMGAGGTIDEGVMDRTPPGMIILDSVSALCGNDKHTQIAVAKRYKQYAVKYKAPTFLIAHMTKESDFAGLMALQHEVDTLVTLFPEEDGIRHAKAWKNRFGATHLEYKLLMTPNGLVAVPPEEKKGKKKHGPPPEIALMERARDTFDEVAREEAAKAEAAGSETAGAKKPPKFPRAVPDIIVAPDGQKLVRKPKKGEPPVKKTLMKEPLTATVKEITKTRASAVEGEALKRRRAPMPKVPLKPIKTAAKPTKIDVKPTKAKAARKKTPPKIPPAKTKKKKEARA